MPRPRGYIPAVVSKQALYKIYKIFRMEDLC